MLRKIVFGLSAAAGLLIPTAHAAPIGSTIFTCRSSSGKIVRFTNKGKFIGYSYGRPGAPDLAFSVPRSASSIVDGSDNIGNGGWYVSHEISVTFAGATYTGWWAFHRGTHAEEGGITVSKGNRTIASIPCVSNIQMQLYNY